MPNEINLTLKIYESLFQKDIKKSVSDIETFLTQIQLPTITDGNYAKDETDITADNLFVALKSKPNNKSPGNDGLSKGFYEALWEDIKDAFIINSIKEAKIKGSLGISQRQAVIKLLEKKDQDKRFIKNWRPTCCSMSVQKYYWIPSQQILKPILPSLISSNWTAYVEKRCINESGRLISHIIETCSNENIPRFLVTMDLEKDFNSLDHDFSLCVLKKIGFGDTLSRE